MRGTRTRRLATLVVTGTGLLGIVPAAQAAQLTVDDDKAQCPSAGFTTIQSAVDAAATTGDTISVCPGTYTEGSGGPGTNGLTITKSVTIQGAGADLVTIQPSSANTPAGASAQIADASGAGTPPMRNATGDVVSISDATVNLSGVAVRSNGVYAESGVHFLNAQGGVTNSRVGPIVTPTGPGAYGANQRGESVDALSTMPAGTFSVSISRNAIDGYDKGGIVVDSAVPAGGVRSNSRVQATISDNRITGAGPLGTTGIAQNGIQVSAGAAATITGNLISDNRFTVSGLERSAAGVLASDAAAGTGGTTITGNDIQNNSFGVLNVDAAGADNDANPVPAQNNWWGNQNGPAVGGPQPDRGDPVNSAAAVPFAPFLTVPITPGTTPGSEPAPQVPAPPTDAPPSVAFMAPSAGDFLSRGAATTVSFRASDDRGVKSVRLFVNGRAVCTDTTAPYSCSYTPSGADVGQVTLIALATDTANQTALAGESVRVARFLPRSLSARTTPGRDRRSTYRFRTSGRLSLPRGVNGGQGCGSGSVAVTYRGRGFTFTGISRLGSRCTYATRASVPRRGRVRVTVLFLGNAVLGERGARSQLVRAG